MMLIVIKKIQTIQYKGMGVVAIITNNALKIIGKKVKTDAKPFF
jgi:hypothetical protein